MGKGDRVEAVLNYLEARRDELIDFACQLIATPSINPPGDERAVTEVILAKMKELGLGLPEVVGKSPERPNVIYRQRGSRGSPRLILGGHTDTKPVGEQDRKLWKTDPLKPTIVDGKLYGLGSTDMKAGIAAIVYATAALHSLADSLGGDLILILVADDEAPGGFGAEWVVKNCDIQADFCLVAEACGVKEEFENVPLCARNSFLFKTKVYGT